MRPNSRCGRCGGRRRGGGVRKVIHSLVFISICFLFSLLLLFLRDDDGHGGVLMLVLEFCAEEVSLQRAHCWAVLVVVGVVVVVSSK